MITEYISYLGNIKGYSHNTAIAYAKDIRAFAKWMRARNINARWSTITREDIDEYVIEMTQRGMKPTTTNRHLASISGLYGYMKRNGYDIDNPCKYESRRKIGKTIPNTIPVDDLRKAYDNAVGAVKVMLGILATTGIRIQELLDMKYEDIDTATNSIKVNGKGNKQRIVYSTDEALVTLKTLKEMGRTGRIFTTDQRKARNMIWHALKPYSNAPQLSPHAIRHTLATSMAAKGTNVSTIAVILGHEQIETTQKYIDMTQADIKTAMQATLFD